MPIKHVFVLMLENRSYDHMLGFSPIEGADAVTGQPTRADCLTGAETNTWQGRTFAPVAGAHYVMPLDAPHEFGQVVTQMAGPGATYPRGGAFPAINNSGYVAAYAAAGGAARPGDAMKCYSPEQLPVLNALAREFALCDNWHASVPGPTWPNRMFVHAASSGGLDHSPAVPEILRWELLSGFSFPNGNLFELLDTWGVRRRLYGGDDFPMVAALKGIRLGDVRRYELFAGDLQTPDFPYGYTFIEPSYDVFHEYRSGDSQHPLGDVRRGESLIKQTYEAIRNSPYWNESMLIVTWDEHGGFYDHAVPPAAKAPGDTSLNDPNNRNGFTFEQYGPRVPAVVISPLIARNVIDHRLYDHASVPRTVEKIFGMSYLTERDRYANSLTELVTLSTPRTDTPETLPGSMEAEVRAIAAESVRTVSPPVTRPEDSADDGNLPAVVNAAMQQQLQAQPEKRAEILERVRRIQTRAEAHDYLVEVRDIVKPLNAAAQAR
jgi:phospholipase C